MRGGQIEAQRNIKGSSRSNAPTVWNLTAKRLHKQENVNPRMETEIWVRLYSSQNHVLPDRWAMIFAQHKLQEHVWKPNKNIISEAMEYRLKNKMQPTNPNAHTYDNGTDSETRR